MDDTIVTTGLDSILEKISALEADLSPEERTRLAGIRDLLCTHRAEVHESRVRDALTGTRNAYWLKHQLPEYIDRAARDGYPLTLAFLDVDHFKALNDMCGHDFADEALRTIVHHYAHCVRRADITGRRTNDGSSDEMYILFQGCDAQQAADRLDLARVEVPDIITRLARDSRVLKSYARQTGRESILFSPPQVTVSAGVADLRMLDKEHVSDFALELVQLAEYHMYCAKKLGRNCVYTPSSMRKLA